MITNPGEQTGIMRDTLWKILDTIQWKAKGVIRQYLLMMSQNEWLLARVVKSPGEMGKC